MMTSSRPRDVGGSFASRRGHATQLSISDPSHHVTEAIGTLYGDDDDGYSSSESRPVSLAAQPSDDHPSARNPVDRQYHQQQQQHHQYPQQRPQPPPEPHDEPSRRALLRTTSDTSPMTLGSTTGNNDRALKKSQTLPTRIPSQRSTSYEGRYEGPRSPMSPLSPSLRDVQADESGSQFPLTHMNNPNDIAQELSNLQALRRMSMDVGNTSDPDLLPFSSVSLMAMPSVAPQGDDDEGDPSRLLWVPARVHPELDTNAFKSFLENRVQSMKRRSGDSMLSVDGSQMNNSSSLRRKKSMLSRQIDSSGGSGGDDYVDGADRLSRKGSQNIPPIPEVSLDELVKDPTKAVQKLAQEARQDGASSESGVDSDIILPSAPGMGLRRSTRTTYRKGGSLRGERVPFAKRIAERKAAEPEEAEPVPPVPAIPSIPGGGPPGHGLTRVQSEPVTENFSRPSRSVRRQQKFSNEAPAALSHPAADVSPQDQQDYEECIDDEPASEPPAKPQQLPYRTSSALAQRATPVPHIVETPPPDESSATEPQQQQSSSRPFPERSSSQKASQQAAQQSYPPQPEEPPARSSKRPSPGRPVQSSPLPAQAQPKDQPLAASGQTLTDMANHPSPLPGGGATRTDSLTFIPTVNVSEDRKLQKKRDSDDTESISSTKSSGWKWFKSDDKEKKRKDKEKEEQAKKAKGKGDKAHDNARLDVLQSSIDNVVAKGRESLLLDRESIDNKLHEERKKESTRKASDSKKEKEGFFGGLFGGSKKKTEKEPGSKKKEQRTLSPEPPSRPLRPDIDFPWSRFTIIEERAIYRMAHIKLANPRRSLQSQVLLSNFMYSYLAKVQAMHPQIQVPISPQQKRQEEERKRKEAEQQQRMMEQQAREQQQAAAQQDGDFNFEYHGSGNQYGDAPIQHDNEAQYIDDSEIYAYDHQGEEHGNGSSGGQHENGGVYHSSDGYDSGHSGHSGPHSRQASGGGGGRGDGQDYYYGQGNPYDDDDDDERNMW